MDAARVIYVMVQLLDHQLVDRHGGLAGKVDDAEIRVDEDGNAYLDALLSGPGVLATRAGHRTYGRWREHLERTLEPADEWSTRIPLAQVRDLGVSITLNADREELASMGSERWVREHVIDHIPGSGHATD